MDAFQLAARFDDPASVRLSAYFTQLLINIEPWGIQTCRLDTDRNTAVSLEAYVLSPTAKDPVKLADRLRAFCSDISPTGKNFPSVIVGIETPFHTLVPDSLYDSDQGRNYLGFNFELPDNMVYAADTLPEIGAQNIYALHTTVLEAIKSCLPGSLVVHSASAILRAFAQREGRDGNGLHFHIHQRGELADMALFADGRLRFFNTFPVSGKEDLLYFILYIIEQEGLSPEETTLQVSGQMLTDPETTGFLEEYLPAVQLQIDAGSVQFSPVFNPATLSAYRHLFSLALCGS